MMLRVILLFALVCALMPTELAARSNVEAQWHSASASDGILIARRSRKKKKRAKYRVYEEDEEDAKDRARPLSSRREIDAHLQSRIKQLKGFHKGQMRFGRRMNASWVKFWDKIYNDRKIFDVRMARQRLNLFESLASLDPSAHRGTVSDFERLQANQVKSFEANLKKQMMSYLFQLVVDLKDFTVEEEEKRAYFNRELMESWTSQKAKKKRKRR